ncbi:hypothetical protein SDC9_89036 [bioreactor metagenome]|uniref:Uncharacterized protein n=1 Tax=bioreactor metagenome TaxID=1076179 RepID=A0A644ZR59_9ZZZZ
MLGVERPLAESRHRVHIAHLGQVVVVPDFDLLNLMGGAEPVEEVQKGYAAPDGGQVGHRSKIHDLLGVGLGQHGEAGLPAGHDVRVVAENVEGVGRKRPRRDVKDCRKQFSRELIHIGDHEQQALRGGIGRGEGARCQGAVNHAGGSSLRLHFHYVHRAAEDVFTAGGRPLVHVVRHRAGRCDGVDTRHFRKSVRYMRRRRVPVH